MTLKEYMKVNNMTLRTLAKRLGMDFRMLHRYMNGKTQPSLATAYKIYIKSKKRINLKDWF